MQADNNSALSAQEALDAFDRDQASLFFVVPAHQSQETMVVRDFTQRKWREGLAIMCWRDKDAAWTFVREVMRADGVFKVIAMSGAQFVTMCGRSHVARSDVLFEVL